MFAQTMKTLRKSHHMTQAQLGELLGLSASAVGMYEQGRREPELSVIVKLCEIFSVDAGTLLGTPAPSEESFDLTQLLDEVQNRLLTAEQVTLRGEPLTMEDVQRLMDALEITTNLVLEGIESHREG